MKTSLIAIFSLLMATSAYSATNAGKSQKIAPNIDKALEANFPWITAEESHDLEMGALDRAKRRSIASAEIAGEDLLSKEYKSFRSRFLKIKSADEIDALIKKLDEEYESVPNDLKFAAIQLVPLRAFHSVIYRMVPLAEQAKVTHSMLLTMVKQIASGTRVALPTEQWSAGFAYVSEPSNIAQERFKTEIELQIYLAAEVLPELVKSTKRLKMLNLQKAPIVADNQLLYGSASFSDKLDRYRLIGEAERYTALSGAHMGISWLTVFCAYQLEHAFSVAQDLGKLYGVDGFEFWKGVEGAPAASRAAVFQSPKYATFLTLNPVGAEWTKISFKHLQQAVYFANIAWAETKGRPASESSGIDSAFVKPAGRQIGVSLQNASAMIKGKTEIASALTGEVISVNLPAFYANPPKDLKMLLPTQFDTGPLVNHKSLSAENGRTVDVEYHNYLSGRATGWNVSAYREFFPDVKSNEDIEKSARILSQTWGGGISGITLAFLGI